MINGNVERCSNLGNARLLTYIDNDDTSLHVFDTKKDEISDKKFLTIFFYFQFKFTLFPILFLILHQNKLYFRSVFNYTFDISYLYPPFLF